MAQIRTLRQHTAIALWTQGSHLDMALPAPAARQGDLKTAVPDPAGAGG
jgi:hypothetical protein